MSWLVFAPSGEHLTPHDLWSAWSLEPSVLIPLTVAALIYLWGMHNVWQRAGTGRGIHRWRYSSFAGALLALLAAFVSPLDALSDVLFSAHMVQHLLLILVAAPLLVTSEFPLAFLWCLSRPWAQRLAYWWNRSQPLSRLWQTISHPISAWLLFALTIWIWHARTLYQAALENGVIHALEHLLFLVTAMVFWWVLLRPGGQKHLRYGMAIPYLFTTILHSGVLGALMTFTDQPWYPYYAAFVSPWGLTPLQDQQLAGLIMWMPGGIVFTLMTIAYFAAWLQALERRSEHLHPQPSVRAASNKER
jgi:putative membrane protein